MLASLTRWGRLPDFEAVVRRFPVAVAAMGLLTLWLMVEGGGNDTFERVVPGLALGGYLCVGLQLASESRSARPSWLAVAKAASVVLALALALLSETLAYYPWIAVLAAIVFLGNFAFRGRARDDARVWLFTQKLWTGAIFAFVGSVVFALGTVAIWETLDALFGVDLSELGEHVILPLGLAFLAPIYWMGTLPDPHDPGEGLGELSFEARALAFLGTWLLAPLTLIYGLIILAYALRVLLTWSLPEGETAQLVTPFLIVGTLTWLMLEPSVMRAGGFVRLYRRAWFPIALVASALLAVAVWMRVSEYGLTPERVFLLAVVAGGLALGAWFTLSPRRDIRIPTAAAAGLLLACAFLAKPAADVQQLLTARAALAAEDRAAASLRARDSLRYLNYRADRADWVRDLLGMDPGPRDSRVRDLDDRLDAMGFRNDDLRRERLRRQPYGHFGFTLTGPADLGPHSLFVGRVGVSVERFPEMVRPGVERERAVWIGDHIYLDAEGKVVRLDVGDVAERLYNSRRTTWNDRADTVESDRPLTIRFSTDGERSYLLVMTALNLNGEGVELSGGYGDALLFRTP